MICIIALVVFGILGIFSAKYRAYAKEAVSCVARKAILRPCNTAFDVKMKAKTAAKLYRYSPALSGYVHRHFEAISWVFTVAMFASMGYSAYALYNLATTGTCDPANPAGCFFVGDWGKTTCDISNFTVSSSFIEFWREGCGHCAKMEPTVEAVERDLDFKFERLEVGQNTTNQAIYLSHVDAIARDCNVPKDWIVTPSFFAVKTGKVLCGEVDTDALKKFVVENG